MRKFPSTNVFLYSSTYSILPSSIRAQQNNCFLHEVFSHGSINCSCFKWQSYFFQMDCIIFLKTRVYSRQNNVIDLSNCIISLMEKKERLNFLASRWGYLITFIKQSIRESDTHCSQAWPIKIHPFRIFPYAPFPQRTNVKDSHVQRWKDPGSLSKHLEKTYLGLLPDGNSLRNMTKK